MQKDSEVAAIQDRIVQEGFLFKESKLLKVWRRRWCVLTPESLCTFKVKDSGPSSEWDYRRPTEEIKLSECESVMSADEPGIENSLYVITRKRTFFLVARSADEKEAWMKAILDCCLPLLVASGIQCSLLMFTITEDEEGLDPVKRGSEFPTIPKSTQTDVLKPRFASRYGSGLTFWLCLLAEMFTTQPEEVRAPLGGGVNVLSAGIRDRYQPPLCFRQIS
mmetsp:Transcript_99703/g.157815  ORF Transcript_99703/g.157815 Transcript_99703/m.157815 type:complete len:221 (+) Transcript_99703:54-716(+)